MDLKVDWMKYTPPTSPLPEERIVVVVRNPDPNGPKFIGPYSPCPVTELIDVQRLIWDKYIQALKENKHVDVWENQIEEWIKQDGILQAARKTPTQDQEEAIVRLHWRDW